MDIVVSRGQLHNAVLRTLLIASEASPVPALADVTFTAKGNTVRVSASDLYMACDCPLFSLDTEVIVEGTATIPAHRLARILDTFPRGPIQLTVRDGRLVIHPVGHAISAHLPCGHDAPPLPEPPTEGWRTASSLRVTLAAMAPFISEDDTRAHVNSLLWTSDASHVRFVATDGHRAMVFQRPKGTGEGLPEFSALIPRDAVCALALGSKRRRRKGIPGAYPWLIECRSEFAITDTHIFIRDAGRVFSAKLVNVAFPHWQSIAPSTYAACATVGSGTLADACRMAVAAFDDGIMLTIGPGAIRMHRDTKRDALSVEVPADYSGPIVTTGINPAYITDALRAIDDPEVTIAISDTTGLDPVVISSVAPIGQEAAKCIIMPMRI